MGMFFNNLHIRKNEVYSHDKLIEMLTAEMEQNGYTMLNGLKTLESGEEPDISIVIYSPEKSEWVSVASDCFNFNTSEDTKAAAFPISEKFGTDVLAAACCDSDYLMMNLINAADGTDGWVNAGSMYGMKLPRRTRIAPWKGKVTDLEKFKAVVKEKNTFAEDAFYGSAELLGMVTEQCALETEHTEGLDEGALTRLHFALPEGTQKELPEFKVRWFSLTPCRIGGSSCVFVDNKGGRSRGVGVMFVGDYIENDQLTFENVIFGSDIGSKKQKNRPIKLKKIKTTDGKTALYWKDESFDIPPAPNPSLPVMRRDKLESERKFGVWFTVRGDPRKVLDVKVFIIPLENYRDGAACWCVYLHKGTKERYIEWNNEHWTKMNSPDMCLDPNDFDL